jgi:iron(III) transport system permease protein
LGSSFLRYWGRPFTLENLSLFQYKELLFGFAQKELIVALRNSFFLGIGAAVLSIVFSFIMAWVVERTTLPGRNILSFLNTSAMSFPAVALALGLIICFSSPPLPLYGTLWIFLVGYMVKGFPISFLFIKSSLKQISPELEEASRILGGSWLRSVKDITAPLIKVGLFSSFLIIFITKFRDLPTSILLYTGGNEVIGVTIFQLVDEAYFGVAAALSSGILLFNLGIVFISNRMAGKGVLQF